MIKNKRRFFLLLLFAWVSYFDISPLASASTTTKELKFKSRDLEKIQDELNKKKQENQKLKKEAEDLSNVVKQQELKIKDIEQTLVYTRKKSAEVSQDLAITKNQHDQVLTKVDQVKLEYADAMKRYYVASLLQGPRGVDPVISRQLIRARASELRKISNESEDVKRNLTTLIETQRIVRNELVKQENKLTDVMTGQENKERLLTKKITRQEALELEMKELERTAQELASLIDVLRAKTKEEADLEKQARLQKQQSGQSPVLVRSLPWPVKGKVLTPFGRQNNSRTGTTHFSNGIIISAESGSQVTAVADGKVLYAGQFMSYGAMTVVEHPGDWYTVYGHLASWAVEKGQEIKKGELVGIPRPLSSGGEEAYFELRFYGKPTDPLPWLTQ